MITTGDSLNFVNLMFPDVIFSPLTIQQKNTYPLIAYHKTEETEKLFDDVFVNETDLRWCMPVHTFVANQINIFKIDRIITSVKGENLSFIIRVGKGKLFHSVTPFFIKHWYKSEVKKNEEKEEEKVKDYLLLKNCSTQTIEIVLKSMKKHSDVVCLESLRGAVTSLEMLLRLLLYK